MWTNYFDKIFLINLPNRFDRLALSYNELSKYGIQYELVRAIKHIDGREGLYQTMMNIFSDSLKFGYERILIFEDDILFLNDPNEYMPLCIEQLRWIFWHTFYLGVNPTKYPFAKFTSPNILPLFRGFSTHAVAYSKEGMQEILKLEKNLPIDVMIAGNIHKLGHSYCSYPLLCTQRAGHSDIQNSFTDWGCTIQERFNERVKHLICT